MKTILIIIKNFLLLPLIVVVELFRSKRSIGEKIGYSLLILIFLLPVWRRGYVDAEYLLKETLYETGITDKLTEVDVRGESMLPTIQNGVKIQLHSPKKYQIQRGDIVSFKNLETGGLHYLKRVVGLSGETVVLKNGYVSINGRLLEENYILNNTPTFGNTFLIECNSYVVPSDSFLVLGDNRTVSFDSRAIGFVGKKDVDGVIKSETKESFLGEQKQSKILETNFTAGVFLKRLNEERQKLKNEPLAENNLLNQVAQNRVNQIKDNFDNWKAKAETVETLLDKNNYRYNLVHEFVTFGYLNEEEVVKQILELSPEKMAFLSNNYFDLGIGVVKKTNQECIFPIISIIIAWPSLPTYSQEVIDSWANEIVLSKKLLDSLQMYVGDSHYDQTKLRSLIEKAAQIYEKATQISQKIKNNEWTNSEELDQYEKMVDEITKEFEAIPKSSGSQSQTSLSDNQGSVTTAPTAAPNSKFTSSGQKTIENGGTAKINQASEEGNQIKITFANISNQNINVFPIRLTMRSQSHGIASEPGILSLPLGGGTISTLDFSFQKIPNPPYKFVYLSSSGESVELGSFSP